MNVSVLIPTYNSAATIRMTLDSVLRQTHQPCEILIVDDGSKDETAAVLEAYKPNISVSHQENRGVAHARNMLAQMCKGELIAYLDHDDIWHPQYLEVQCKQYQRQPDAAAFFTGHVDFKGFEDYSWAGKVQSDHPDFELINPVEFFVRYNNTTGPFGSVSYLSVPRWVLTKLGPEPFRVSGVDDSYLCYQFPLLGRPVIYTPELLVAYRIIREAQSTDKLKAYRLWVQVFELLERRFGAVDDLELQDAFWTAFAARKRSFSKILMGAGNVSEARLQLKSSLCLDGDLRSKLKSLILLGSTYAPSFLQPSWPSSQRIAE